MHTSVFFPQAFHCIFSTKSHLASLKTTLHINTVLNALIHKPVVIQAHAISVSRLTDFDGQSCSKVGFVLLVSPSVTLYRMVYWLF